MQNKFLCISCAGLSNEEGLFLTVKYSDFRREKKRGEMTRDDIWLCA